MNWTLEDVNKMNRTEFVEALGWIFEHSPWVADRAYGDAPYSSLASLHEAMTNAVRYASREEQLTLLRAHPDLAGKLQMTNASVKEQRGAGLTDLTPEEFADFTACNAEYTARFGIPFIMAVRGQNKYTIREAMGRRLDNSAEEEFETALRQVFRITRFRLEDLIHVTIEQTGGDSQ